MNTNVARSYEMHRTISRAFPGSDDGGLGRVLFRVDTDSRGGNPVILVQSEIEPDWSNLHAGYLVRPAEFKPFAPVFANGQKLRFRLRANPTKRVAAKNERLGSVMAGKRVGLATETEQIRWLLRKGETGGFEVPGVWVRAQRSQTEEPIEIPNFRVDVIPEGRARNDKAGHRDGSFVAIRFDGVLEVTNVDRFRETVFTGVGSAKGFGFGLLSVAPA